MEKIKKILFICLAGLLASCNFPSDSHPSDDTPSTGEKTGISNKSVIKGDLLDNEEDPLVKWEGRNEFDIGNRSTPSRMYLYHTGTGFSIDFYGTSLEVDFYHSGYTNVYYEYSIDDEVIPTINRRFYLPKTDQNYTATLASGLEEGHHTVRCLKASEPFDGVTAIEQFRTDGNFYYRNGIDNNDKLKFMFINASSGSGFGGLACTEGSSTLARSTKNSSSLHSYMYMTARRFDADFHYIASAGWGVAFPTTKAIPEVFDYTGILSNSVEGAKTTKLWDHQSYVPDVILMHIGGNDINASNFDITTYQEAIVNFVDKLHKLYPLTKIIYMHTNTNTGAYAMNALEEFGAIKKGYLKEVILPKVGKGETGENTYGAANHQSFKTHLDASKIITQYISSNLNYQIVRDALTYEEVEPIIEKS
ncbi:MAG: hypothetical protein ACI311_07430 [Bacilli bacterium]